MTRWCGRCSAKCDSVKGGATGKAWLAGSCIAAPGMDSAAIVTCFRLLRQEQPARLAIRCRYGPDFRLLPAGHATTDQRQAGKQQHGTCSNVPALPCLPPSKQLLVQLLVVDKAPARRGQRQVGLAQFAQSRRIPPASGGCACDMRVQCAAVGVLDIDRQCLAIDSQHVVKCFHCVGGFHSRGRTLSNAPARNNPADMGGAPRFQMTLPPMLRPCNHCLPARINALLLERIC